MFGWPGFHQPWLQRENCKTCVEVIGGTSNIFDITFVDIPTCVQENFNYIIYISMFL